MLPEWLNPNPTVVPFTHDRTPHPRIQIREQQFEYMWDNFLDRVVEGMALERAFYTHLAEENSYEYKDFVRWFSADKRKTHQFEEAKRLSTFVVEAQVMRIAEASDDPELKIKTLQWYLKAWNRQRYGDTKQIEMHSTHMDLTEMPEGELRNRIQGLVRSLPAATRAALEGEFQVVDPDT